MAKLKVAPLPVENTVLETVAIVLSIGPSKTLRRLGPDQNGVSECQMSLAFSSMNWTHIPRCWWEVGGPSLNISQPHLHEASLPTSCIPFSWYLGQAKPQFWDSPMILSVASLHHQARLLQHLETDLESECEKSLEDLGIHRNLFCV